MTQLPSGTAGNVAGGERLALSCLNTSQAYWLDRAAARHSASGAWLLASTTPQLELWCRPAGRSAQLVPRMGCKGTGYPPLSADDDRPLAQPWCRLRPVAWPSWPSWPAGQHYGAARQISACAPLGAESVMLFSQPSWYTSTSIRRKEAPRRRGFLSPADVARSPFNRAATPGTAAGRCP